MSNSNRGELGCALVVVVAVLAGIVFLIAQAPWLVIGVPIAVVLAIVALVLLANVVSDDVLVASEEPGGFAAKRIAFINKLRAAMNKQPMWQVPELGVNFEERQIVKRASQLAAQVAATLKTSPTPESVRSLIAQQASDIPANLVAALWRLSRLRRTARSFDLRTELGRQRRDEIAGLEHGVLAEMQRALDTLSGIPVGLMQTEQARADRSVERLAADLNEANQQLQELSATYEELRVSRGQ
jgi:hypothetical protein